MKRKVCTAVCALAVSAVVWGCGGGPAGADAQNESGMERADVDRQGTDVSVADHSDADAGQEVQRAGTTFSILGDSISTFQGYNPMGYYAFSRKAEKWSGRKIRGGSGWRMIWSLPSTRMDPAPGRLLREIPREQKIPSALVMSFVPMIFPARRECALTGLSYIWEPMIC